jgi:hypothetical protein
MQVTPDQPTRSPIAVLEQWIQFVRLGDAAALASLYAPEAVLIPTFARLPIGTAGGIRDYFVNLCGSGPVQLEMEPAAALVQPIGESLQCLSGTYDWCIQVAGESRSFTARYTFIVDASARRPILHHHSSRPPCAP